MAIKYLRPESRAFTLLLGLIASTQALATSITLPALPLIADTLHAPIHQVQLTVSGFLGGLALSLIFTGALADRFGRKPVLLAGLSLFTLSGIGCAFAPSIEWLIAFRILQGMGGASGMVMGRAVIRDLFVQSRAIQMMSYIGTVISIMPMLAPILTSGLLTFTSWRIVFLVLSAMSLTVLILAMFFIAESLRTPDKDATNIARMATNSRRFLTTPISMSYVTIMFISYGAFFAYMAILPYVLVKAFDVSITQSGFFVALVGISSIIGTVIGSRLAIRWPVRWTLSLSTSMALASGLAVLAGSYSGWRGTEGILVIVLPMIVYGISFGITHPTCIAAAMQPVPQIAGIASGITGTLQMSSGAVFAWLAGQLFDGTPSTIGLCVGIAATLAFLVFFFIARPLSPLPVRA